MKLYTEEALRKRLDNYGFSPISIERLMSELVPIEPPSDEEIHKQAINYTGFDNEFKAGAKWMRDKIQGDNNEQ